MMAFLRKMLWPDMGSAITRHTVEPEKRTPARARETKEAQSKLAVQLQATRRTSWEVRQALASGALDILTGEDR